MAVHVIEMKTLSKEEQEKAKLRLWDNLVSVIKERDKIKSKNT